MTASEISLNTVLMEAALLQHYAVYRWTWHITTYFLGVRANSPLNPVNQGESYWSMVQFVIVKIYQTVSWVRLCLSLYHWFTGAQRSWSRGWAGDSYVVCLHLTSQREGRMWEVWLSILVFFPFFPPFLPPICCNSPGCHLSWLTQGRVRLFQWKQRLRIPQCRRRSSRPLPLPPFFPQSYQIEWMRD